ncbi:MAG: NAD-dependent epimerase/dehydratase family protein [Deltaproteobacteria bacterium]|nr:NAD-dependent epimerase/dehydratase family protein [Deltaproteobacteria bacterium]
MRVMVTGGTGFAGSHTVRAFLAAGHSVRLLVRDPAKVRRVFEPHGIGIPEQDVVVGDIVDETSVAHAMAGCDAVFHGAALVEMKRKMAAKVLATNRRGVELVVGGAVKRGLPRIVYVSSMSVFFEPGCGPLDLDMPVAPGHTAYAKSKSEAEHMIRRMQEEGAPIRVSYPTGIVGPDDPGLSEANQAVYTFLKQTGVNTSSGFQIVDVRDLAVLHAKLLELPGGAARYAAAGPMLSWPDTYRVLDDVTGKWIWRFPVPGPLFRALGTVGDWIKHVYDFSFPLSRDAMEFATQWPGTSAARTTRELGIRFRDAHETYADTLRWLYEAGHLKARHVGRLAQPRALAART